MWRSFLDDWQTCDKETGLLVKLESSLQRRRHFWSCLHSENTRVNCVLLESTKTALCARSENIFNAVLTSSLMSRISSFLLFLKKTFRPGSLGHQVSEVKEFGLSHNAAVISGKTSHSDTSNYFFKFRVTFMHLFSVTACPHLHPSHMAADA